MSASGRVSPSLAVSGVLKELDLKELIAFWPVVPADGFDGRVSLSFRGEENGIAVPRRRCGLQREIRFGYPVDSVRAKWALGADRLSVTDLDAAFLPCPFPEA